MIFFTLLMANYCGFEIPKNDDPASSWGHISVGFDLLNPKDFKKNIPITVFDSDLNMHLAHLHKKTPKFTDINSKPGHGTSVLYLFAGRDFNKFYPNFSIPYLINMDEFYYENGKRGFYSLNPISNLNPELLANKVKIANFSYDIELLNSGKPRSYKEISWESKFFNSTIAVVASGNSAHIPIELWTEKLAKNKKIILVSGYNQYGLPSVTNRSKEIDILAPNEYLPSYDNNEIFHGNSGAAPLVSRSLGLALNFIETLSTEEAKILLKKTSFFGINQSLNIKNRNYGILNVVHLIEYSRKLRKMGFNKLSKTERFKMLNKTISIDVTSLKEKIDKSHDKINSKNCTEVKAVVNSLRYYFHLTQDPEVGLKLYQFFKKINNEPLALFYLGLAGAKKSISEKEEGQEWISIILKKGLKNSYFSVFQSTIETLPYLSAAGPLNSWFTTEVIIENFSRLVEVNENRATYYKTLNHLSKIRDRVYNFGISKSIFPEHFISTINYLSKDNLFKLIDKILSKMYKNKSEKNISRLIYSLNRRQDKYEIIEKLLNKNLDTTKLNESKKFNIEKSRKIALSMIWFDYIINQSSQKLINFFYSLLKLDEKSVEYGFEILEANPNSIKMLHDMFNDFKKNSSKYSRNENLNILKISYKFSEHMHQ